MSKKKRKIKKRRHISSEQLFKGKVDERLMLMDMSIRQAFPDPVKRQEYIKGLIAAFDKDIAENGSTSEQIE